MPALAARQEAVDLEYKGRVWRLDDILVDKFCPGDLIAPGTAPLLLQPQAHKLQLSAAAHAACRGDALLQVWGGMQPPPELPDIMANRDTL